MAHNAFDVFINDTWVNRVFDSETDPDEVKRSLINHDGYYAGIEVQFAGNDPCPHGDCWREDEIQRGYRTARRG